MQIDAQNYLELVESKKSIVCWDTESQGFEGDYGRLYVASVKQPGRKPVTFHIGPNAQDKGMVKDLRDYLNEFDCWVTFYGKGHDVPLVNTRLLRWGYEPLQPRHHVDMYFTLKYKLKTGRKSQAHLLDFLQDTMKIMGIKQEKKMSVSPNVWSDLWTDYNKNIQILIDRCESDTVGLETLYRVTKHLIRDIKRG